MSRDMKTIQSNTSGILVQDLNIPLLEATGAIIYDTIIGITKGASIVEEKE